MKYEELTRADRIHPPSEQASLTIQPQKFSSAATTRDFLEWWRWDSISAACVPRCEGCRCGNCQPGGKEMTLAEERELEVVRSGLTYALVDDHSERPHWHARYPWVEDPATLPNNRKAVESTEDRETAGQRAGMESRLRRSSPRHGKLPGRNEVVQKSFTYLVRTSLVHQPSHCSKSTLCHDSSKTRLEQQSKVSRPESK